MPSRLPSVASAAPVHPDGGRKIGGRFGGLDGLRAIAVGLVLIYHFFPSALPGGFLGVDVFFVISGFLITSLLLRELQATGRIDLIGFWRRRARRLLPAVALVVLVSTTFALAASRDLLVGIAQQIAGAVFFVSNWVFIATGTDYFARDTPELFRNFWSLALEEQFYIVLPILAILLFKLRSKSSRGLVLVVLGIASALFMAGLALSGADPTRIYFGSDSHSFGLFLGAAMAIFLHRPQRKTIGTTGQVASIVVAIIGFTVLGVLAFTLPEASPESFIGGFQVATLASLAVVWAITREGAWAGKALDISPLRWIGERSYGIYLWHWPLLLIATSLGAKLGQGSLSAWLPQLVTLALTLLFAEFSFRYVEQPVRALGLRNAFRAYFTPRKHTVRQRNVAVALTALLAITFPLTGVAVALAPAYTSSAESILRGEKMLEEARNNAEKDPHPTDAPNGATADDSAEGAADRATGETGANTEPAPPAPIMIDGRDITAIGDSVMLASYPELAGSFAGIDVDAAVSRGLWAGVDILAEMQSAGRLRTVIVVGLGTNGPIDNEALDEIHRIAGTRPVVLVNAHGERDWIPPVNDQLAAYAAAHNGVTLARWNEDIAGEPEALAGDGIHPGPRGGQIYTEAVRRALDELATPGEAIGWGVPRR